MDYSQITQLLDKYWEGETSLAEETQLKNFFAQDIQHIPTSLRPYQAHFQFLKTYKEENVVSDTFEEKMMAKLQAAMLEEEQEKVVNIQPTISNLKDTNEIKPIPKKQKSFVRQLRPLISIAATLTLLIGSISLYINYEKLFPPTVAQADTKTYVYDENHETQEAYEATKFALSLLSSKMNSAKKHLKHLDQFDKSTKRIFNPKNKKK